MSYAAISICEEINKVCINVPEVDEVQTLKSFDGQNMYWHLYC